MKQIVHVHLDKSENGHFSSSQINKECYFKLLSGDRLTISWRDCIEIFCTVADNMPPDFDRDGIFYEMLDKLGLEE